MYVAFGGYRFLDNVTEVTISKRPNYSERGERYSVTERWNLKVDKGIQAASAALITTQLTALEDAFRTGNKNLSLHLDDGTPTRHIILTGQTYGGTRVVDFGYPEGRGAEYSTFRTVNIAIEAEIPDLTVGLLAFSETLKFSGGGPKFVMLQTLTGLPQRQEVAQATPYRATQSGRAVGHLGYITVPAPIFPGAEHQDRRNIEYGAPRFDGLTYREYPTSWSFEYESAFPLNGLPNTP